MSILLDQVLVNGFSPELLEERKRLLSSQLLDLQSEQTRTQAALASVTLGARQEATILHFAEQVRSRLKELTPAAKRQVLELLQVKVDVTSQTEFSVTALIPISERVEVPRLKRSSLRRSAATGNDNVSIVSPSVAQTHRSRS